MKRVLAAVVAIGLIAAGFVVNSRRTDPERGREPLVLWCVPDAADVCKAVASDRVLVRIRTPTEIESDVIGDVTGDKVDAVVTSSAWLDQLDDRGRLAVSTPLASAPIVMVSRAGESPGCSTTSCFLATDRKVALPEQTSLAASLVIASALGDKSVDTLTSRQLTFIRDGGTPTPGVEPITALVTVRLVDVVITLAPSVTSVAGAKITPFAPPLSLTLKLGTIRDDPRIDALANELRDRFGDSGWNPRSTDPASPTGPDASATLEAYVILNP